MKEQAIIIFQKNPEPGKVKTKLEEVIGTEKAVEVYEYLLNYTHELVQNYPADVFVYFQEKIDEKYLLNEHYHLELSEGGSLTDKIRQAFNEVFEKGYEKVLIIRMDTLELTNDILDEAFEALDYQDMVVGPDQDGMAYLLGMNKLEKRVLEGKEWKHSADCDELFKAAKDAKINAHRLPMLFDVEQYEDLKSLRGILNIP
ncbi:TIGR04282 family arsenosugar biosynthesis glycosyltransferase [Echinicola sediminis]